MLRVIYSKNHILVKTDNRHSHDTTMVELGGNWSEKSNGWIFDISKKNEVLHYINNKPQEFHSEKSMEKYREFGEPHAEASESSEYTTYSGETMDGILEVLEEHENTLNSLMKRVETLESKLK